jgi:hypothetical protein
MRNNYTGINFQRLADLDPGTKIEGEESSINFKWKLKKGLLW